MSWIPAVSKDQASPEVKRIYEFLGENWGFVPNYFLALGRDPQLLQDQVNLFTHVMFEQRVLPKQIKRAGGAGRQWHQFIQLLPCRALRDSRSDGHRQVVIAEAGTRLHECVRRT